MRVVIEGSVARIEKSVVEKTVSLDNFLTFLQGNKPFITDLLPIGTRAIGMNKNLYGIMVEEPDTKRIITWKYGVNNKVNLFLYIPNIYWFIGGTINPVTIHKVGMGFAENKIMGSDDIGYMSFPNCSYQSDIGIGILCLGDKVLKDNQILCNAIAELLDHIWNSHFNLDLFNVDSSVTIKAVKDFKPDIEKEIKEYDKKDEWASFLAAAQTNGFCKYMLNWHMLTAKNDISELRKMFKLPVKKSWRLAHSKFIEEMRFS